jgi:hypothetical protein
MAGQWELLADDVGFLEAAGGQGAFLTFLLPEL